MELSDEVMAELDSEVMDMELGVGEEAKKTEVGKLLLVVKTTEPGTPELSASQVLSAGQSAA